MSCLLTGLELLWNHTLFLEATIYTYWSTKSNQIFLISNYWCTLKAKRSYASRPNLPSGRYGVLIAVINLRDFISSTDVLQHSNGINSNLWHWFSFPFKKKIQYLNLYDYKNYLFENNLEFTIVLFADRVKSYGSTTHKCTLISNLCTLFLEATICTHLPVH